MCSYVNVFLVCLHFTASTLHCLQTPLGSRFFQVFTPHLFTLAFCPTISHLSLLSGQNPGLPAELSFSAEYSTTLERATSKHQDKDLISLRLKLITRRSEANSEDGETSLLSPQGDRCTRYLEKKGQKDRQAVLRKWRSQGWRYRPCLTWFCSCWQMGGGSIDFGLFL